MSAKYMSDYFTGTVTADYTTTTLTLKSQGVVTEEGYKNQVIHLADDNTEERITLTTGPIFYVTFNYNQLSESDAGTIFDLYHDPNKANGMGRSFKYTAHDTKTYVVRFDSKLSRSGNALSRWGFQNIRIRVLGVSA